MEAKRYMRLFSSWKLCYAMSRVFYMAIVKVTQSEKTKHAKRRMISMKLMWCVMPWGEQTNARLLK